MISTPGIYSIANSDYHADPCPKPSLSASVAKTLLSKSPRHAWVAHPRLNPAFQTKESGIFDLGKTAHSILLEGVDICEVCDFDNWTTKAAREARDNARAAGRAPLLAKDYETVLEMVMTAHTSIRECADLNGLTLADGKPEQTLLWREPDDIWCRARLDWISNDRSLILDYKTTSASALPSRWVRTMLGIGGEIQPGFYLRGNAATGGPADARWVYLVQETYPPYACSFIRMSDAFLALSRDKTERAIKLWAECVTADKWPAYPNTIEEIDAPLWMTDDEEEMHL